MKSIKIRYIILIILAVVVSIYFGFLIATRRVSLSLPIPTFPKGEHTYNISYGPDKIGPRVNKAVINPTNPEKDQSQTISLYITSEKEVLETTVQIIRKVNNFPNSLLLNLTEGTNKDGVWSTTIKTNQPYTKNYSIRYRLADTTGSSVGELKIE